MATEKRKNHFLLAAAAVVVVFIKGDYLKFHKLQYSFCVNKKKLRSFFVFFSAKKIVLKWRDFMKH